MPAANPRSFAPWLLFAVLVAVGVVGRWGQPDWCVTPLAAVGLMAGYALPHVGLAIAAPLAAVLISNLLLEPYQNGWVALSVYGAFAMTGLLGRLLRRPTTLPAGIARLAAVAASPSLVFFAVTNFAVWASQSMYPKTAAGLAECYVAALPFFRRMLVGDLAYTALVFGVAVMAGVYSLRGIKRTGAQTTATA